MKRNLRIGLFGGSFDPVHSGHMALAAAAKRELKLDRVVFIPARIPPHKLSKHPAPGRIRFNMLRAALKKHPGFSVSRYELDRKPPTFTFQTAARFEKLYPRARLFFIIGADSLLELGTWKNIKKLVRRVQFATAGRRGVKITAKTPFYDSVIMLKNIPPLVSSSRIRELAGRGEPLKGLVPPVIERIIRKGHVYKAIPAR